MNFKNGLLQVFVNVNRYDSDFQDKDTNKWAPCSPDTPGSVEMTWAELSPEDLMEPKSTLVRRLRATKLKGTVHNANLLLNQR